MFGSFVWSVVDFCVLFLGFGARVRGVVCFIGCGFFTLKQNYNVILLGSLEGFSKSSCHTLSHTVHTVNKPFLKRSGHNSKIPLISNNLLSCMLQNTKKKQHVLQLVQSPTSSPSRNTLALKKGKMALKLLQTLMSLYHLCLISNFKPCLSVTKTGNLFQLELKLNSNSDIITILSACKHAHSCIYFNIQTLSTC